MTAPISPGYLLIICSSSKPSFLRRSPSLGVCNFLNYSCPGVFTDQSFFSLNLPRIQPLQEPQWPITSTDFIISPED